MERSERATPWVIGALSVAVVGAVAVVLFGIQGRAAHGAVHSVLPELNAACNATSAVCLIAGYMFVRRKRIEAHRICMLAAMVASLAFLVGYLTHHAQVGSVKFQGTGLLRSVYFVLLLPHTILAAVLVPFALTTVYRAFRADFARHRRVARWTFPIWLFVSVSGVAVYVLLYHFGQSGPGL